MDPFSAFSGVAIFKNQKHNTRHSAFCIWGGSDTPPRCFLVYTTSRKGYVKSNYAGEGNGVSFSALNESKEGGLPAVRQASADNETMSGVVQVILKHPEKDVCG
ncbi:hypothetical protein TNIN_375731 [Trichonephila inaurata madagascariensis]|uniref:Uncharacterized protein n=1 Tax=Trichonephila inaurata madagascariensis TaxID=2747483 RepID=A0A8X6XPT9_9ARAC|nr:hypothetical protein TNIN_375731 [Trichonephila inaurata madagascariensis]